MRIQIVGKNQRLKIKLSLISFNKAININNIIIKQIRTHGLMKNWFLVNSNTNDIPKGTSLVVQNLLIYANFCTTKEPKYHQLILDQLPTCKMLQTKHAMRIQYHSYLQANCLIGLLYTTKSSLEWNMFIILQHSYLGGVITCLLREC